MADINSSTFRTSFNGFNKADVASYITKTAEAHAAEIEEYRERITELEDQLAALEQENSALLEQLTAPAQADTDQLPETADVEVPADEESLEPAKDGDSLREQELLAYRRAEAVERMAYGRARTLYGQMQELCGRSTRQVDESKMQVKGALEAIGEQLKILRDATGACHDTLEASARELHAMEQTIPDPAEGLGED